MTRHVCIGECMVEMAPTEAAATYRMGFAGDTMNTAWYLRRRLDAADRVDYFTAVGTDTVSDQLVAFLKNAGIGTDHVQRRPDLTVGLYMIQLDQGERSFNYWRGQSAARTLAQDVTALDTALRGAEMAYFSGITAAILPKAERAGFLDALLRFRAGGGQVVFDPNLRPKLWPSPDDMTNAIMDAAAVSTMVLPSFEDEAAWFGDADPTATAQRYAGVGARTVLVKNGSDQIVVLSDGQTSCHPPEKVDHIVDTTAAGDSFNAGYLAAILTGAPLAEAVAKGASLAARVIQSRGALVEV